ncbi:MAG: ArsR/SmtB family transcription factor [Dehalococcoidia bacterium]
MDGNLREDIYRLHAGICKALAHPKRLLLINELRDGSKCVQELAAALELSQANVSQHLAILLRQEVVYAKREGSMVYYRLASPKIVQALDILLGLLSEKLTEQAARGEALAAELRVGEESLT